MPPVASAPWKLGGGDDKILKTSIMSCFDDLVLILIIVSKLNCNSFSNETLYNGFPLFCPEAVPFNLTRRSIPDFIWFSMILGCAVTNLKASKMNWRNMLMKNATRPFKLFCQVTIMPDWKPRKKWRAKRAATPILCENLIGKMMKPKVRYVLIYKSSKF